MIKPIASIIILTFDSYKNKFGCVEHSILSVLNQSHIFNYEIIIINNAGETNDYFKLKDFIASLSIKNIRIKSCNLSIAEARNLGAKEAKGEVLIFIDEDIILLNQDTIETIVDASKKYCHGYGAVRLWTPQGKWFKEHSNTIKENIKNNKYELLKSKSGEPNPAIRQKESSKYLMRSFIGNFGFATKKTFNDIGGFPDKFQGYGLEDDALCFLYYLKFGQPFILDKLEIIHVTHEIKQVKYNEYKDNLVKYNRLLNEFGVQKFHIGNILYGCNYRKIVEVL